MEASVLLTPDVTVLFVPELLSFPVELGKFPLKSKHLGVFQGLLQWDHGNLEVNEANM